MYLKSIFPDHPPIGDTNFHYTVLRRPDQASWKDFTLHIDAATGRKQTYRGFLDTVYDGATALGTPVLDGGLGLCPDDGEMVAILSENSMDYITLIHSLLVITVPFVLLSCYSTPFELDHALRLSTATRLFVSPNLLSTALGVASKIGMSDRNIYTLEGHVGRRTSFGDMVTWVRTNRLPRLLVRPAKKDTLAYLVFSSGTSGLPKAVMISHGNLFTSMCQGIVVTEEVSKVHTPPALNTPEEIPVSLAFLPFHHVYGLHSFSFRAFLAPSTTVILPKWSIDDGIRAIAKYRVSRLMLIPSVIHQLVNYPKIHQADFSSLLHINSGAGYLPPKLAEGISNLLPREIFFSQGYGLSETTLAITTTPFPGILGGRGKRVPGSVGILLPGMEARILRDDGSETDINEPGEIWVKGGNVAMGYWHNEKASKETFVDGWLRTGDRVRVDDDGALFFEDRRKDTLKVSGMQVSPTEIEDTLLAQPDRLIIDVAVAGVSGGRTVDEKIPRAWIVLSEAGMTRGPVAVVQTLETWSRQNLSKYKWLRGGVEIVENIPRSPTGKVLRRVLQDHYEARMQQMRSKL